MDRPWYRSVHWVLAGACVIAALAGVLLIHSATLHDPGAASEARKQSLYVLIGIAAMIGCAAIDHHRWERWAVPLYIVNCVLLAAVLLKGHSALGAQRWISLGPLGTFQPSEPAKLIVAITSAAMLGRTSMARLVDLAAPVAALALPAVLILKQPDFGTTLVLLAVFSAELYFAVGRLWLFGLYSAASFALGAFVVGTNVVLKPFQRARLLVFLNPHADPQGAGWNLNQSKIAVGSGEFVGKGLFHGTQTQLNFVPEHSRDFIFTVIGEELGFVGACALLALYAVIIASAVQAMLSARDRFGFLLAAGIIAMFVFHIVVNVGMTVGVMPITGIPLPFMSYGGSAIITDFAAIGVLLSIHRQRDKLVF